MTALLVAGAIAALFAAAIIIGRDASGKVVAHETADLAWKARQIAAGWRGAGLDVEVAEWGDKTPAN